MGLTVSQIDDLLVTTDKHRHPGKWTDLSHTLVRYTAMPVLLGNHKNVVKGGTSLEWRVQTQRNGSAQHTTLYDKDTPAWGNLFTTAEVPWRHGKSFYGFDVREQSINSGQQLLDLVKSRKIGMQGDQAQMFEEDVWSKPDNSSDNLKPFGIPYYVVKNATEGLNGGNPAGFTAGAASVDSATYDQWRNWTAQYSAISVSDFVRKAQKASDFTKYEHPVGYPAIGGEQPMYGYYTNYNVKYQLEEYLRNQNDNLGMAIDPTSGKAKFRGVLVNWVPYLDNDTTDPFYGLDWSSFEFTFVKGENFRESPWEKSGDSHNIRIRWVDWTYNLKCVDRRRNFVLYK